MIISTGEFMKKLLFVFNPNSGKAQLKNKLMQIVQIFSEGGYDVTVYPTKAAMDGYNYIIENGLSHDVIVCSGGDGTLNETVGAVLHLDERIPIGYIPSGTTNDFARSLGIPKDMIEAAKVIVKGRIFNCDIGMVDGQRSFNYVAAFGAFTEVSYNTPQQLKNVLGHQAYIIEAAKQFMTLKPCYVRVKSDIKNVEGNFVYGMVSNTKSVGGMKFLVGGSTDLQDGLFEVTLIREIKNPMDLQQLVNAFMTQKFDETDMVCSFKTNHVEFESPNEIAWTLDGEFGGSLKKTVFDVMPKAVDFIVRGKKKKS